MVTLSNLISFLVFFYIFVCEKDWFSLNEDWIKACIRIPPTLQRCVRTISIISRVSALPKWCVCTFLLCMAGKGKSVARQPSTRTRGASSRRKPSQEAARYETPAHAERGELVVERKRYFWEHIARRGWDFMYDPTVDINMTLVWEFYANRNEKNQGEVYMRGRKIPCYLRDIEDVLHLPRLEGKSGLQQTGERYDNNELDMNEVMQIIGREGATWPAVPGRVDKNMLNKDAWMWMKLEGATWPAVPRRVDKNLLNKDAWMWMKLVVSNIMPTRHETTLGIDHILLIYALMTGMSVFLPGVMVATMNDDPVKTKKQLLPFPMFITKWAAANEVPTYPGDEIFKVPKAQQFFPYVKWKTDSEVERNLAPPAPARTPAPVPPPASRTRAPTSSRTSSSQQSRDDLMRALRRNECIMRRHEQLMLMLHPDLDMSQLQQVSSPEVSEQQQQAASDSDDGDSSDEDGSDEESSEE
ncbi:hypothetical protein PIB30_083275 [Stylosanthes scabra]|uniref:Putative plant transposon protein domain-containing protein n=1 Tax=Stylosanthes scabra TaxID=79078 RepID=A0ABU6UR12_9FABA|nr:hypothetical protein [Stylosanthes scabra]